MQQPLRELLERRSKLQLVIQQGGDGDSYISQLQAKQAGHDMDLLTRAASIEADKAWRRAEGLCVEIERQAEEYAALLLTPFCSSSERAADAASRCDRFKVFSGRIQLAPGGDPFQRAEAVLRALEVAVRARALLGWSEFASAQHSAGSGLTR